MQEANVKANRMGRTKWTYYKKRSSTSKSFILLKLLFQFKYLLHYKELI